MTQKLDHSLLPAHIAIIMDGNGRWAKKRGLPRVFGHRAGVKAVRSTVENCAELGIKVLTLYAFSTENWVRPKTEISVLMSLLRQYLKSELKTMNNNNIRFNVIGDLSKLSSETRKELEKVVKETSGNTGLLLNVALNYGSRQELVKAFNALRLKKSGSVTEAEINENLYTAGMPDPDLLIRTSGERRLSNFLLWQIAYAELYFTDTLWPDFSKKQLLEAISDFRKRNRRFGGI